MIPTEAFEKTIADKIEEKIWLDKEDSVNTVVEREMPELLNEEESVKLQSAFALQKI